jgi:hypothetical protein
LQVADSFLSFTHSLPAIVMACAVAGRYHFIIDKLKAQSAFAKAMADERRRAQRKLLSIRASSIELRASSFT